MDKSQPRYVFFFKHKQKQSQQVVIKTVQYLQLARANQLLADSKTKYIRVTKKIQKQKIIKPKADNIVNKVDNDLIKRSCSYFCGNVLDDQDDFKQYLTDLIEKNKNKIKNTKLLFRFDPWNKTNIHKYVDERTDIVLVAKTKNGYHLCCYSEAAFGSKDVANKVGIICSLTNRKHFKIFQGRKLIVYDNLYLIFGNSEIRVSASQKSIFSNFGVNNGYFNANGDNVNTLLGEGTKRTVQLEALQIFQVQFE